MLSTEAPQKSNMRHKFEVESKGEEGTDYVDTANGTGKNHFVKIYDLNKWNAAH